MSYISDDMTLAAKCIVLHDWLINHMEYVYGKYGRSSLTILIDGTGVCEGYASAYKFLLGQAGVKSKYIIGTASGTNGWEGHAWNMVLLDDNNWYHVDTTFDDQTSAAFIHNYLFLTDEMMSENHKWGLGFPRCIESVFVKYYDSYNHFENAVDLNSLIKEAYIAGRKGIYAVCETELIAIYTQSEWDALQEEYKVLVAEERAKNADNFNLLDTNWELYSGKYSEKYNLILPDGVTITNLNIRKHNGYLYTFKLVY